MTHQMSNTSIAAEDTGKASIATFLADQFVGGGFESEECEPISDGEFKVLMTLVVFAAFAFGCIVNGWLL